MLPFINTKGECTGCTACMASCPVQCIHMEKDEEGFFYPVAGNTCIHCNKCEYICPQKKNTVPKGAVSIRQVAYAGVTKDYQVWLRSASGGAFSEICKAWGDSKTFYYGAAWDQFEVHHIRVNSESISEICKSKYVASSMDNCFCQLKEDIQSGKKVVFAGTPCQVSGLRRFLGKNYDNLLLVDLICHGVGSPKVLKDCLEIMSEKLGHSIQCYEFRSKRGPYETDYMSKVTFDKGGVAYLTQDPYMQLFLRQDCLRPSCGKNCKYRSKDRQGDITIADFKGLLTVFPELRGTKLNYSTIVANTIKGAALIEQKLADTMELHECSLDVIEKYNPLFFHQTDYSEDRDCFFKEFIANEKKAILKHTNPMTITKKSLKRTIFDILPIHFRRVVLNIKK